MRAARGLGYGAMVGMGAGIATALAMASLTALSVLVNPGDDSLGTALTGALVVAVLVAFIGSLIGGTIGGVVGMVLGLVFGATGSERLARWITPALLPLAFAALYSGEIDPTIGFSGGLAVLAIVGALGGLGFIAGVVFERLMTDRGHRSANIQPPVKYRLQEIR